MKLYFLFFVILSFLFYSNAPIKYSPEFCQNLSWIFIINTLPFLYIKAKRYGIVNFYTFFILSIYLINFLHAAYAYPVENLFRAFRDYSYNENIINISVSFVLLCISSFIYINYISENKKKSTNNIKYIDTSPYIKKMELSCLVITSIFFIYSHFIIQRTSSYGYNMEGFSTRFNLLIESFLILTYFLIFINKQTKYLKIYQLIFKYKILVISTILFSITLISYGSRVNTITMLIAIGLLFNRFYKKFPFIAFIFFIIVALISFTIITITRVSDINLSTHSFEEVLVYGWETTIDKGSIYVLFTDMIVNARNLYDGYDYINKYDLLYGLSHLPVILGFIPFLGIFVLNLLGYSWNEVNTSSLLTQINNANFGLGTNLIGDLCINYGHIGAYLFFILAGYLLIKIEYGKSFIKQMLYLAISTFGLYTPRAAAVGYWLDFFYMLCIATIISSFLLKRNLFKLF